MATYSFTGKRVLVTGGANGLGREIVERFLGSGATVVAVDRDANRLENLKQKFPGSNLETVTCDLSNWKVTAEAIEKCLPIHHLVNNVGIVKVVSILDVTETDIDAHFNVNFKAAFNVSRIFARGVKAHGLTGGTIVHISSLIDRITATGYSAYSCSKAALTMLSRTLAAELGQFKIRSNVIRPDLMKTDMFSQYVAQSPEFAEKLIENDMARSTLKRVLEPRDLGQLVLFLSSDDSSIITGVDIVVDGGYSLT